MRKYSNILSTDTPSSKVTYVWAEAKQERGRQGSQETAGPAQ